MRVLLFGDSVALTLGLGLSDPTDQDKYGYVLSDKGILGCGVVNGPEVELMGTRYDDTVGVQRLAVDARRGRPITSPGRTSGWPPSTRSSRTWSCSWPGAGRWSTASTRGTWTNILNPAFAAYVKSQLEQASKLVTATGARMVFLTAPCTDEGEQPDGAPWPEDNPARLAVYNKLVREVAAEHPPTDSVVDLYAAACPGGKFATTVDGVDVRRPTASTSPIAGGSTWRPRSCRRSWRPGGRRWREPPTQASAGG